MLYINGITKAVRKKTLQFLSAKSLGGLAILLSLASCKKLVEADPPKTSLSQENVYNTDAGAISALTGVYYQLSSSPFFIGSNGISLMAGLSADEFTLSNTISTTDAKYYFYIDSLFSNTSSNTGTDFWRQFYNIIFRCNLAVEGISESSTLTSAVKTQLLGEAKFIRAFSYFYLTNFYGDVPIILSSDWQTTSQSPRSAKSQVYQQILTDLSEAQQLLSESYLDNNLQRYTGSVERVRPTKWAALALLARVYLYIGDWVNAEAKSSEVINNTATFNLLGDLNLVFLKNSVESIWQLQPTTIGQNTPSGALFLITSTGPSNRNPVYLSPSLLNSFEPDDKRRFGRRWVDSLTVGGTMYFFPYKYKQGFNSAITNLAGLTEYEMVFRLSEQYLIRAEARAHQNKIGGAQLDLNAVRNRAGLGNTSASNQPSIIEAIRKERRVELFSEWGHRWFDLKRTNQVDSVMSIVRPQKTGGKPWQPWMQLYPILFSDIQKNPNLLQNAGY